MPFNSLGFCNGPIIAQNAAHPTAIGAAMHPAAQVQCHLNPQKSLVDGIMALAAIRRIANGYPFKEVQAPIIAAGELTDEHLKGCRELGLAMALGLEMGLF